MAHSTSVYAGDFHHGRRAAGKWPQALDTWRVTTDDAEMAARLADLHGGQPSPNDGEGEGAYEVLTARETVRVLVDGPGAVTARMVLWGSRGKIHECDGTVFLRPDKVRGQPCGCPPLFQDRKALAREGRGPQPVIALAFRLMAQPPLGNFRFRTGSWEAFKRLPQLVEQLEAVGGPAVCDFITELVTLTTKNGQTVGNRKLAVTVLGALGAAPRNPHQLLLPQRFPRRRRHTVAYPVHVLTPRRQPSRSRHAPSSWTSPCSTVRHAHSGPPAIRRPSSPPLPWLFGASSRPRNSTNSASTSSASLPLPNKRSEPKAPPLPECDVVRRVLARRVFPGAETAGR